MRVSPRDNFLVFFFEDSSRYLIERNASTRRSLLEVNVLLSFATHSTLRNRDEILVARTSTLTLRLKIVKLKKENCLHSFRIAFPSMRFNRGS